MPPHAMLLVPLTGHIDSHGTQRLLAGDGLLDITRLAYPAQHVLWSLSMFSAAGINAEFDIQVIIGEIRDSLERNTTLAPAS